MNAAVCTHAESILAQDERPGDGVLRHHADPNEPANGRMRCSTWRKAPDGTPIGTMITRRGRGTTTVVAVVVVAAARATQIIKLTSIEMRRGGRAMPPVHLAMHEPMHGRPKLVYHSSGDPKDLDLDAPTCPSRLKPTIVTHGGDRPHQRWPMLGARAREQMDEIGLVTRSAHVCYACR